MEAKTKIKKRDNWFYYKLVVSFLILSLLLTIYIFHMVTKTWLKGVQFPFSQGFFQWQFFSFFTYQSNFIVAVYFLISAIHHQNKKHFIHNQNLRIAITCYITVTMVTWTCFLFPGILISKKSINVWILVQGIILHLVFPVAMIVFTFQHLEPFTKTVKKYYAKTFWIYLVYPLVYTLFIGLGFWLLVWKTSLPLEIIFPYAPVLKYEEGFYDYLGSYLATIVAMLGVLILSFTLFVLVNIFYVFLIKRLLKKRDFPNQIAKE